MLFEFIQENSIICIFHHERADFDALGSSFALKCYLEEHYQKEVYIVGKDVGALEKKFPKIEDVSDETIAKSYAIILDTANKQRIDDCRIDLAKKTLKIDHHINVDHYTDIEIVDEQAAATCEILAKLFYENKKPLSKQCAVYLYQGLLSDTINYTTSNTTAKTLYYGSYIASYIDKISEVALSVFDKTIDEFKYENYLKQSIQYMDDVAYVIIEDEYTTFNIPKEKAKEMVYVMANIIGINKWALFIKMKQGYGVSLRSKLVPINTLANAYNGGGHKNACGIKNLPKDKIPELIEKLVALK